MALNTTTSKVDGVFVVYLSGAIAGGIVMGTRAKCLRSQLRECAKTSMPRRMRSSDKPGAAPWSEGVSIV